MRIILTRVTLGNRLMAGLIALWALSSRAEAQTASAAAATLRDTAGRSWAYLTWTSDDPDFLRRANIAVYRKNGAPESTESFQLVSIINRNPEAAVIGAALQRAERIGQNLAEVSGLLQGTFPQAVSAETLTLTQKVRLILDSATANPEVDRTLQFLVRTQPAIAAAVGQAFIVEIPTGRPTTFELRLCDRLPTDPGTECVAVMARLTLVGGAVTPLPKPGAPADVSWKGPRGDLNVRLIWSTPNPLRAEVLLQAGFNVYRVKPGYHSANFASRAPVPGELARAALTSPNAVRRISAQPIFPDGQLTEDEVIDWRNKRMDAAPAEADGRQDERTDDEIPFFAIDDNQRFEPGGEPFRDGDQFYYYVVARDLLGRDGLASDPTLVTLCRRLAPVIPKEVTVEIASSFVPAGPSSGPDQHFRVRWARNPTNSAAVPTDFYRIYRWDAPHQVVSAGAATNLHIKEVPAGDRRQSFYEALDDTPSRPKLPEADQITYWYTVRAVRRAPCGDELLSGHSAPVPGVLRTWEGPGRASGEITVFCVKPKLRFVDWASQPATEPSQRIQEIELKCSRETADRATAWAEYYLATQDTPDPTGAGLAADRFLGRIWFGRGELTSTLRAHVPRSVAPNIRIRCRIGNFNGEVSDVEDGRFSPPAGWSKVAVNFAALLEPGRRVPLSECDHHNTRHPETGRLEPVGLRLHYTAATREHRVYSSTDNGPLELVLRGTNAPSASVLESFSTLPGNAAQICLYYQNLDSQGLAGPMIQLGCFTASGQQEIPTPMLSKPRAAFAPGGSFGVAELKWFCPPHAVERFRVFVGVPSGVTLPDRISPSLYPSSASAWETVGGRAFRVYETGRVGANFGVFNEPNFTTAIDAQPGVRYTFMIQAVNAAGEFSAFSEEHDFEWTLPGPPEDPALAWPARALSEIRTAAVTARHGAPVAADTSTLQWLMPESWTDTEGNLHVGVLIGETSIPHTEDLFFAQGGIPIIRGIVYAEDLIGVLRDSDPTTAQPVFPCVLYRFQVPNEAFPEVTHDIVQVSPLMRAIAYRTTPAAGSFETVFLDPFIDLRAVSTSEGARLRAYLKDTQPVVAEAEYRYLLVRFTNLGEVVSVAPTAGLTIP